MNRGALSHELADRLQRSGLDTDKNAVQRIESGQRFVTDIELVYLLGTSMRSFCKGIKLRAADSRPYESERPSFSVGADALTGPRGGTFVLQTRPGDYENRDVYRAGDHKGRPYGEDTDIFTL